MARRRRPEEPEEAPQEPRSDDLLPEDFLAPFWALADVRWPHNLSGDDLVAWARLHAPHYAQTAEQARANRDRRLAYAATTPTSRG
jgi:hypothetical protein